MQPLWQQTLVNSWQTRAGLAWLLWPVSLLYGALVGLRRWLYRHGWLRTPTLPVPVVVVGNVVAGGAGKTPVVIEVVRHLQRRGLRVGIISRGYGRRRSGCLEVSAAAPVQDVGDEPALIQRRTQAPLFVAERRVDAARALLRAHPQTQIIVSDDGLQHLALPRAVEVVVFDERGTGNGWLLPAGPLREPWPRHAAGALTLQTGQQARLGGFVVTRRLADFAGRCDGSVVELATLKAVPVAKTPAPSTASAKPLWALAAIARPEAFFAMLRAQGLPLAGTLALPDHFDFSSFNANEYKGYQLICTEKDAVKLWPIGIDALAVPLHCTLGADFLAALDGQLAPRVPLSLPHGHKTT